MLLGSALAWIGGTVRPEAACAKYGDSTNIAMPSYIDYLVEKNSQGSVVAPDKILYQGADPSVLLRRLQEADRRLDEIPALAEQKKWSQIAGLVTGPLGTLSQTITQIATSDTDAAVQKAGKKVRSDVIAIGQAASRKSGEACTETSQTAIRDLEVFVELAFCRNKTMVCFDASELSK
jgi:hypothetical protein